MKLAGSLETPKKFEHVPRSFAVYVKIIFRFLSLKLECLGKVQWIMYSVIKGHPLSKTAGYIKH